MALIGGARATEKARRWLSALAFTEIGGEQPGVEPSGAISHHVRQTSLSWATIRLAAC
jgi:hypothetical protein